MDASICYASRLLRLWSAEEWPFRQVYIQMRPPRSLRGGVLIPIESGLHLLTLVGAGGESPPADESGFRDYARSLPEPWIARILDRAEPAGAVRSFRRIAAVRRRFDGMEGANFVSLGDSSCAFNPVYGQGMTVAMLQALELVRQLGSSGRVSQHGLDSVVRVPWLMGSSEDLRVPGRKVEGVPVPGQLLLGLAGSLTDSVIRAASRSRRSHLAFLRALHLMDSPASLLGVAARGFLMAGGGS